MTSKRGTKRVVLIGGLVGAALLLLAGFWLWRWMPGQSLGAGLAAEAAASEYVPPEAVPAVLPEARLEGVRVAILGEPENAILMIPGYYEKELARWREWLADTGAAIVAPEAAEVLVLPLADCLGPELRDLVRSHLRQGGGLVTSGVLGSRDGYCAATPDTVLHHLLGRQGSEPILRRTEGDRAHVVVLGETMLAAGIPAGARIDLEPQSHVVFRGPEREAYFADYERQPQPLDEEPYFDGAVARSIVGDGRVAVFGFGLSEVLDGWSEGIARLLVRNAVQWAAGRPVVQLATWPAGYEAAAVIAQDVEADYANAAGAIDLLERKGVPTTYFIVGRLARNHPFITRDMVRSGELGSHSFSHRPMDSYTAAGQREELELSMRSAEEFAAAPVRGFRPPEERFTLETLRAWAELGGDYVFAVDHGRSAVPVILPYGPDSLVFISRTAVDDYEILSRHEMRDRGAMAERLIGQIDEVVAYRGAYLFSYHSHMLAQKQLLPVLEALVDALKERPHIWMTTAGELARWWRTRAGIEVVVAEDGLSAEVRNPGRMTYGDGALLVDLPNGERRRLPVPDLPPGEAVRLRWN